VALIVIGFKTNQESWFGIGSSAHLDRHRHARSLDAQVHIHSPGHKRPDRLYTRRLAADGLLADAV